MKQNPTAKSNQRFYGLMKSILATLPFELGW
jgi:hypothetical protein